MKKGTKFELFVKSIYEEILAFDGYDTVAVEHDVKILGKSNQLHQIDVYWEFITAGVTHRVAVECKDYNTNKISVGKIRDFYGVLDDIGNIFGIFVTTIGYQSGAITYAKHKDISLKVVQEPTQHDLDDYQGITSINLNTIAQCLGKVTMTPIFDIEWILKNTTIKEGDQFSILSQNNEIKIIDSNYNSLGTILDFENKLPRTPENSTGLTHRVDFNDGFMHIPNSEYPLLKVKSINFVYDTYTINSKSEICFKLMAEAVIKDIITGASHLFNKNADK